MNGWWTKTSHARTAKRNVRCAKDINFFGRYKALRNCGSNFQEMSLLGNVSGLATYGRAYMRRRKLYICPISACVSSAKLALGYEPILKTLFGVG